MASAAFHILVLVGCFLIFLPDNVSSNRVLEKMYEKVQSDMACFKRFNGTHEIGCTSDFWGNVGVIHFVENIANLTWVLVNGPHPPYVLALIPELFTVEIIKTASDSGKIAGIVILKSLNFSIPSSFSGEQTCPNRQSSLYLNTSFSDYCENTPWNPNGSSLLYMNWNFPIFLIDDEDSIEKIIAYYNEFNKPINEEARDWPLCAIELHSSMYATTNSKVCLRRSDGALSLINLCEPLEDINIWGSIHPFNTSNPVPDQSIYIVSTSSDSASLFDGISPGANAVITGLVTLLATSEALFRYQESLVNTDGNVLFTIFEGEAWDYIGSSRMVYDMIDNKFPYDVISDQEDQMHQLNLSHIASIIDIKQTGLIDEDGKKVLYLHTDPLSNGNEDIFITTSNIINALVETSQRWDIEMRKTNDETPVPPSSFQTFLKKKDISGVVITDHQYKYNNQYYMSIYDNAENVNFTSSNGTEETDTLHKDIASIASIVASSLYKLLTGRDEKIEADSEIINKLLYCFLQNMNCTYFQENSDAHLLNFLKPSPAKTFVSVKRAENPISIIALRILTRYMGKKVDLNETACRSNNTQLLSLIYFPYVDNGTCFESSVHHSSALSPAFLIKDYDWESNEYSTWTESIWFKSEARIFLRPSPSEEVGLIIGGVISILLSIFIVYFFNSKANIIFNFDVTPTPC